MELKIRCFLYMYVCLYLTSFLYACLDPSPLNYIIMMSGTDPGGLWGLETPSRNISEKPKK